VNQPQKKGSYDIAKYEYTMLSKSVGIIQLDTTAKQQ